MIGVDRTTGRRLGGDDHLRQSLQDLLTTPLGTRVMRREYGCNLPALIDAPTNPHLAVDVFMAVAEAVGRWEPRIRLERIRFEPAGPGGLVVTLDGVVEGRAVSAGVVVTGGAS